MTWLIGFWINVTQQFNALVSFMNEPIDGISDFLSLLGIDAIVTPLSLVSVFIVTFILGSFILRIVRG